MPQQQQGQVNYLVNDIVYSPEPGVCDEVFDDEGKVRPHWEYLINTLKSLGKQAFTDREAKALRILRDDGATYNIYNESTKPSRTWGLDLVPNLINSAAWGKIEAGLLERAELFDLLLKDIYGPKDLIRTGVIPPEALFAHSGFLRPCHGVSVPGDHQLILHAVDLMRGADGELCVLTDRTQSPSGAGYALENRTVMSRVFPSLFRDSHVHRLATFFQKLRSKLSSLAVNQDHPRVVVLTPGAHNETYFEHAYIANYLGLHLVQSGDLIVRGGYVWMKSFDGLSRVDVILRRVDDWYCDPVELRSDSVLGVANILEVVRAGNVVIANPLGSGILENPIFLKYLPQIAKALLGRELRLKSVDTYWCGDPSDLSYVLDNIESLVIKPIQRATGIRSVLGSQLDQTSRQAIIDRIKRNPYQFVAQAEVTATHLPSFINRELTPRPAILRTFALACDTSSYALMPGGLTRIGVEKAGFLISNQAGSQSKDTWVIASEPERAMTPSVTAGPVSHIREADLISLPSRVVENLFWMGRYAERAETSLRYLRTVFMMFNGEDVISDNSKKVLLKAVTAITATRPGFEADDPELFNDPEEELLLVVKDGERLGSVRSNLDAMLYCSDQSKELLSSDTLRVLNDIRDALSELDAGLSGGLASAPEEALDPLVTALMALTGLSQESMMRGTAWRFMDIGRRLERGQQIANTIKSLLTQALSETEQHTLIHALLLSLEVLISYRRRYRASLSVPSSLDLVMLDTANPRSLLFQLDQLTKHLESLPKALENKRELSDESRSLLEAETLVKLSKLAELSEVTNGRRERLIDTLEQIGELMGACGVAISEKYFEHRESSRQLVHNKWENET